MGKMNPQVRCPLLALLFPKVAGTFVGKAGDRAVSPLGHYVYLGGKGEEEGLKGSSPLAFRGGAHPTVVIGERRARWREGMVYWGSATASCRGIIFLTMLRPLSGREVEPLIRGGFWVLQVPLIHTRPRRHPPIPARDLFAPGSWILLSSLTACKTFFSLYPEAGTAAGRHRFWVVGRREEAFLRARGIEILGKSPDQTIAGLIPLIASQARGQILHHPTSNLAERLVFPKNQMVVREWTLYENHPVKLNLDISRLLEHECFRALFFAAPSHLSAFQKNWPGVTPKLSLPIGPTTAGALANTGFPHLPPLPTAGLEPWIPWVLNQWGSPMGGSEV